MTRITIEVDDAGSLSTKSDPENAANKEPSGSTGDPFPGALNAGSAPGAEGSTEGTTGASGAGATEGISVPGAISAGPAPASVFQAGMGGGS